MNEAPVLVSRLLLGLVQGLALYLVYDLSPRHEGAGHASIWPVMGYGLAVFIPLAIIVGLSELRARTLVLYGAALTLVLSLIFHHVVTFYMTGQFRYNLAAEPYVLSLAGFVFVAQALVTARDGERKLFASYPRYFDTAWKLAVQVALSVAFTGAFWIVLWIGAGLFAMLDLKFFRNTITSPLFGFLVTPLIAATAIHITDVRPAIIRGLRTLKLTLFAWLLPVMTLIAAGFLISLPLADAGAMNRTHATGYVLIGVGFILIYLLNAAYQDGGEEQTRNRFLKLSGMVAAAILPVFTIVAAYRLGLRIEQDGLTIIRVFGCACVILLACHAFGYAAALFGRQGWLKRLEPTNVVSAFVFLALYFALFTPIADPARLSVAAQVARLEAGRIAPDKFDYAYLQNDAGLYGTRALDALKTDPNPEIASRAAKSKPGRFNQPAQVSEADMKTAFDVYPTGQSLPDAFYKLDWNKLGWPNFRDCPGSVKRCNAFLLDMNGDGQPEILLTDTISNTISVFVKNAGGSWTEAGSINPTCGPNHWLADLKAGNMSPAPSQFPGLRIGNRTFNFIPKPDYSDCR